MTGLDRIEHSGSVSVMSTRRLISVDNKGGDVQIGANVSTGRESGHNAGKGR
jgi:hypothetical protein